MSSETPPPGLLGTNHLQQGLDGVKNALTSLDASIKALTPEIKKQAKNLIGNAGNAGMASIGLASAGDSRTTGRDSGRTTKRPVGGDHSFAAKDGGGKKGGGGGGGGGRPPGRDLGDDSQPAKPPGGGSVMAGLAVGAGFGAVRGVMGAIKGDGNTKAVADTVMAQLKISGISRDDTKNAMKGDVTAANAIDSAGAHFALARQLNIKPMGQESQSQQAAIGVGGAINSGRSNQETANVSVALNQNMSRAKLKGLGINMNPGGEKKTNPLDLAHEILKKIPNWQTIDTPEKITQELDDPNGNINLTLINWEANGYLPQGSIDVIKEHIRSILTARLKGMGFNQLKKMGGDLQSKDRKTRGTAEKALKQAGVYEDSVAQAKKSRASGKRDIDLDLTDAYATGVKAATSAMEGLTSVVERLTNVIGKIPIGDGGSAGGSTGGSAGGSGAGGASMGASMGTGMSGGGVSGSVGTSQGGIGPQGQGMGDEQANGKNAPAGTATSRSGSGKDSGVGKKNIKFVRPVPFRINSPFGPRRGGKHDGIDMAGPAGTPIHAAAAGRVTFSGSGPRRWAGNWVGIDHGGGVWTLYGHQSRTSARVGSMVQQGQVIGYVGTTGKSTGNHLHFQLEINRVPVNPVPYMSGASIAVDPGKAEVNSTDPATPGATGTTPGTTESQFSGPPTSGSPGGVSTSEASALSSFAGAPGGNTGMATPDTSAVESPAAGTAPEAGAPNPGAAPGAVATPAPTNVTGNKALGKKMAAARGWTGKDWDALHQLWQGESGWKTNADNPTSSAYGIPQALTRLHFKNPAARNKYMTDPATQIAWGMDYIAGRYGTPGKALSKWKARSPHWYEKGAWEIGQDQEMVAHKGEMIIPALPARQIREVLLNGSASGAHKIGATSNGLTIKIEKGAITVQTSGGVTATGVADLGKAVADALANNEQIKRLQAGVIG